MIKIIFELNTEWVLSHRNDNTLPIENIAAFLCSDLEHHATVERRDFDYVVVRYDNETDLKEIMEYASSRVYAYLYIEYVDFQDRYISCREYTSEDDDQDVSDNSHDDNSDNSDDDISDELRELQELLEQFSDDKDKTQQSSSSSSSGVFKRVEKLINGEEFKAFAKELQTLAPQIIKNKTDEILLSQKYLFSISDGCGLDNFLNLMRDLFNSLNFPNISLKKDILMGKIPPQETKPMDIEDYYLREFTSYQRDTHLVCVDISEWIGKTNGEEFRKILEHLIKMRANDIVVFTVPFVDKEVLGSIRDALNDLMFVKTLTFPPLTMDQIMKYAKKEMESFGFKIKSNAWSNFQRRIVEESSDGRFHGIETVKKVVRELLYNKQLKNALNCVDDHTIDESDTASLCHDNLTEGLSGMEMLDKLVGTDAIKQKVLEIIAQIKLSRQNSNLGTPCLHMRFLGNPGTGKTTVARIIGKILKENGILRIGEFHEHSGRDFCGRYIGETAPKTSGICRDAYGSILFIDEAYTLYHGADDTRDFGKEALDTLIAEMENHRNDLVVIMAGYTDDMEHLMQGNLGLQSRMPYSIEFPNFTRPQLYEVFCSMVNGKIECEKGVLAAAEEYFLNLAESWVNSKQFSNGRFVRNLFERCCAKAAMRCQLSGVDKVSLTLDDFKRSIADREFSAVQGKRRIGFGN